MILPAAGTPFDQDGVKPIFYAKMRKK